MVTAGFWPVGRHQIHIGFQGPLPELVGKSQVVTHEQTDPDAINGDGDHLVARSKMLVFAAVRKRVDLAVAMHCAIGAGQNEDVVRPLIGGLGHVSAITDFGTRATNPQPVQRRLSNKELTGRPIKGLAKAGLLGGEACRKSLAE